MPGLPTYLARRRTDAAWQSAETATAFEVIAAERRKAQDLLDSVRAAQIAETNEGRRQAMEQAVQTLGALVRELDRSAKSLLAGLQAIKQLDQVEARLAALAGSTPSTPTP